MLHSPQVHADAHHLMSSPSPLDVAFFERKLRQREAELTAGDDGSRPDEGRVGDFGSARIERERHELQDVRDALARIATGEYGKCLRCGRLLDRARLELFPTVRFDMGCMELDEREHNIHNPYRGSDRPSRSC